VSDKPVVLFLCVHNAGRSLAARVLLEHHAAGRVEVRSAGSEPSNELNPAVVALLSERGLDASHEFPKPFSDEDGQAADVIVTMGCGDTCPFYPGKRYLDWDLEDPAGKPVEEVRPIVDEIDRRVVELLLELTDSSVARPEKFDHGDRAARETARSTRSGGPAPVSPSQAVSDPAAHHVGKIRGLLVRARVDFAPAHTQPRSISVIIATVVALAGSLAADAILVAIGTRVLPSTEGFVHFHFSDYGKLTVIGVIVACAGWPIVARVSSAPRWLFVRLAILVTLVLWVPDAYIWLKGEQAKAVVVLMVMHLAIALVTYNALVHLAPVRRRRSPAAG
jgi:protein-tyrosine-phosphatase